MSGLCSTKECRSRMQFAVAADHLFDGKTVRRDHAAVIDGPVVRRVLRRTELPGGIPVRHLPDGRLAGAWIHRCAGQRRRRRAVQRRPEPSDNPAIAAAHRRFGTTALLPTCSATRRRRCALPATRDRGRGRQLDPSVIGVHYEGPFLSPERPGVHDRAMIRRPEPADLEFLTGAERKGVTARHLGARGGSAGFHSRTSTAAGVRVSLGHSMATYAQTRAALAEGLSGFTHLFNAMRPLASREPGPIAAALEEPRVVFWHDRRWRARRSGNAPAGIARRRQADAGQRCDAAGRQPSENFPAMRSGHHGDRRAVHGRRRHARRLHPRHGERRPKLRQPPRAAACREHWLSPPPPPRNFWGSDTWLGRLAPGYRADMVALDPETVGVFETWVAGTLVLHGVTRGHMAGCREARHRARRGGNRPAGGRSGVQNCSPAKGGACRAGCRGSRRCRGRAAARGRSRREDPAV